MKTIYATIGAPASGKSTWANDFASKNGLKVVCPDTIRKQLTGSEENQDHNRQVFNVAAEELNRELKSGKSVVFDATNTTEKNRRIVYGMADIHNTNIEWHVFQRPLETLLKQNKQRKRQVPDDIIKRFHDNFTIPTPKDNTEKVIKH